MAATFVGDFGHSLFWSLVIYLALLACVLLARLMGSARTLQDLQAGAYCEAAGPLAFGCTWRGGHLQHLLFVGRERIFARYGAVKRLAGTPWAVIAAGRHAGALIEARDGGGNLLYRAPSIGFSG
jgi:hypothetical protein